MPLACPREIGMNLGSSQPRIVRRRHNIAPVEHGAESSDGAHRLTTPVVGSRPGEHRPSTSRGRSARRNHHTRHLNRLAVEAPGPIENAIGSSAVGPPAIASALMSLPGLDSAARLEAARVADITRARAATRMRSKS